MGGIASRLADVVIVTNDNPRREYPRSIIDDILGGVSGEVPLHVIEDTADDAPLERPDAFLATLEHVLGMVDAHDRSQGG